MDSRLAFCNQLMDSGKENFPSSLALINTLAAAAGSVSASYLLLPTLGLWKSFAFVGLLLVPVACFVLLRQRRIRTAVAVVLTFSVAAAPVVTDPGPERWARGSSREQLIRRWESPFGWIDVVRNTSQNTLNVRQNLHYRFGRTGAEADREYRQAHIPLLLHPDPSEVLFLGLGTGITAAGAIPHAEVRRAIVVELIPEVVDAARLLEEDNFGVVDDPKFDIYIDDGRHFLLATPDRFDVIISDLFVPWESETGYLYTVEHYQTARHRLQSGGIFCQWLALYQLGAQEFEMIADSFVAAFPHTTLWWGALDPERPILALVGSDDPIQLDGGAVNARLQAMQYSSMYADDEVQTAEDLAFRLVGRWTARNNARLNTDEHPRIEFSAPLTHRDRRLLQGRRFRRYFDRQLSELHNQETTFDSTSASGWIDSERRLAWQKFILWGSSNDEGDTSGAE